MKKYIKVDATLAVPLTIEFEVSKNISKKELQQKVLARLKIEAGYAVPDLEFLESDIRNIKVYDCGDVK